VELDVIEPPTDAGLGVEVSADFPAAAVELEASEPPTDAGLEEEAEDEAVGDGPPLGDGAPLVEGEDVPSAVDVVDRGVNVGFRFDI